MYAESPLRISQLNELLSSYLRGLRALRYLPVRAVLYGFYAKGKPRHDGYSDVGLAIWLENELDGFWTEYPDLLHLTGKHHPISPRFYKAGAGTDVDPFIGEILATGKELSLTHPQYFA
jgi:hypothetical protein